jgi:gamma-glutamyltranspeptidase/glutathione hydrolase
VTDPELADALERFGAEGAAHFYTGDVAAAVVEEMRAQGGSLGAADLAAYEVLRRAPVHVPYRDTVVCTNPPPSAGGVLVGRALAELGSVPGLPDVPALVAAMVAAERERTPEFLAGLSDTVLGGTGRLDDAACASANRLGSTTHVSVLDADGWACAVTTSNGEGSGVVVPGTGVHLNNVLGEEDLSPLGFHVEPPGRRLPSMMAPTVVLHDGVAQLVVGSAGSNRIRSALLQVIVNVVDRGLAAQDAVDAPRVHYAPDELFAEPGIPADGLAATGLPVTLFRGPNLYFGGCQAVVCDRATGALTGGADPRRGGGVAVA